MTARTTLLKDERGAMALKLAIAIAAVALATHPHRALAAVDHLKTYWEGVWSFTAI